MPIKNDPVLSAAPSWPQATAAFAAFEAAVQANGSHSEQAAAAGTVYHELIEKCAQEVGVSMGGM